ncbi:MAG TPA: Gfo/Idh/MocA family oxidoreductase, partial [Armatimonadota bacterium]|nr:Gfo/Idh/MocA family oxidoreductase [Armatimonadota bacterium]
MSKLTRRELLEDALWAATVAATAGAAQGRVWAQQANPGRKIGPNDQVRIAVIGVRGRGRDHLAGYAKLPDVQIAAVCDTDLNVVPDALKIVTKAGRPEPKVVQDLRRIMDDPSIDAVSIATPNHWHSLAGIWAMQAGKDVYVEKPVSHNVHEGRVLVDTARKYKRICQAGTQIRSQPGSRDAIQYIHDGKIGKVEIARGLCYKPRGSIGKMHPGMVPQGVDYNLWVGPAPMYPYQENKFHYNWHWLWETGNGDLGNQGIHQMDVARWGLNKSTMPASVLGFGGRLSYQDDGETPNTEVIVMDYGDGQQLIFEVRGLKTNDYRGAKIGNVFHGTDGYVVLTSYTGGAAFDKDGKMVTTFQGAADHFRNFIDCMRSRKVEDLHGEIAEGHLSSALCHLGNVSYRLGEPVSFGQKPRALENNEAGMETLQRFEQHLAENGVDMQQSQYRLGRKLTIDPAKERFKGDKEANAMLFRHYRAPFVVPE